MRPLSSELRAVALFFAVIVGCQREDEVSQMPRAGAPDQGVVADDQGAADATPDAADLSIPCAPAPLAQAPSSRLWPTPGELFYMQVGLGGLSLGEAAIVVGPQGRIVLIDVGNDSHDDDLIDALDALIMRMNATGLYPQRAARHVDAVVLTHFHADHADGLEDLLGKVRVDRLIHRGFVDLTDAANDSTIEKVCAALHGSSAPAHTPLCEPRPGGAACHQGAWDGRPYQALSCDGLFVGDLERPALGAGPSYLALGRGARQRFVAANGFIDGASFERAVRSLSTAESNDENARSVVGVLEHGPFRLLFNGDLTGGGDGTADVESFILTRLARVSDLDARGVDVLHLGHHGRKTSSSGAWLDGLLPKDGLTRNAIMGISAAHLGSPHQEVLDRLFEDDRLSGGFGWSTTGHGDRTPGHKSADGGHVIVRTAHQGAQYLVQLVGEGGALLEGGAYHSVRGCGASSAP